MSLLFCIHYLTVLTFCHVHAIACFCIFIVFMNNDDKDLLYFKKFLNIQFDFTPCPIIYCYRFNLLVLGE